MNPFTNTIKFNIYNVKQNIIIRFAVQTERQNNYKFGNTLSSWFCDAVFVCMRNSRRRAAKITTKRLVERMRIHRPRKYEVRLSYTCNHTIFSLRIHKNDVFFIRAISLLLSMKSYITSFGRCQTNTMHPHSYIYVNRNSEVGWKQYDWMPCFHSFRMNSCRKCDKNG